MVARIFKNQFYRFVTGVNRGYIRVYLQHEFEVCDALHLYHNCD